MADPIRAHRVKAFCEWLETIPPEPPFHQHPGFRFFSDLTDEEFAAAKRSMRIRGMIAQAEADRLAGIHRPVDEECADVSDAILHLKVRTSGMPRGDVSVSADALHVVLSYLEYLEGRLDIIPTPGPEAV